MADPQAETVIEKFEKWRATLPKCVGDAGSCDGGLVGLDHEETCPMFGKEYATRFDSFSAGFKAAEARNEALLQALKEIGNFVGSPILSYTSYLEKDMEFLARIHAVSSIVRTALDSGSASQEAKTPGGENA